MDTGFPQLNRLEYNSDLFTEILQLQIVVKNKVFFVNTGLNLFRSLFVCLEADDRNSK
jgi:hypothetical protein